MNNNAKFVTELNQKINNKELAAAYKWIDVTMNELKPEAYDITVEFLRKHGGSPWRKVKLVEGLTESQTVVAACVLRKYCIEETRVIDVKDHLPNPDRKDDGKAKAKKPGKAKSLAAGIVAVK